MSQNITPLRVLVACEYSGATRNALRLLGHDAYSCDLLPSDDGSKYHIQGDCLPLLSEGWDMIIGHPPCTYLCSSGLHWNTRRPERAAQTDAALAFVLKLYNAPVPYVAIENPIGCLSTRWRKPDQIVQPWQFGDDASKATCLWLKGLPLLQHTNVLEGGKSARRANQTASGQNKLGPSADRWKLRSVTYPGIAAAMADQWAGYIASWRTVKPLPLVSNA